MTKEELLINFREIQCDEEMKNKIILKKYCSVISDDVITLSVPEKQNNYNINNSYFECFDIILNKTGENIGSISFDYYSKNLEFGNVSYAIYEQYQNKGYATRALRLLVQLLKNNNHKGDRNLYFWVGYYNDYSKKVILNNGGEIISGGEEDIKSPYTLRIKI